MPVILTNSDNYTYENINTKVIDLKDVKSYFKKFICEILSCTIIIAVA